MRRRARSKVRCDSRGKKRNRTKLSTLLGNASSRRAKKGYGREGYGADRRAGVGLDVGAPYFVDHQSMPLS